MRCVGLDDLEFLPTGDALLTRRAKANSARFAVLVRHSRNRDRYERSGLLVEGQALADARGEVAQVARAQLSDAIPCPAVGDDPASRS